MALTAADVSELRDRLLGLRGRVKSLANHARTAVNELGDAERLIDTYLSQLDPQPKEAQDNGERRNEEG